MKKFLLLVVLAWAVNSYAQLPLKASVSDLAFIAGKWTVQHEWGDMEETWGAPMGDNMMGSYRCVNNGKIVFYEFMVIEQTDSVPVMRLRHFGPGSIGWEDKDHPNVYPLVQLSNEQATFERPDKKLRLLFWRKGPEQLTVTLEREGRDGKWEKDAFDYRLKD